MIPCSLCADVDHMFKLFWCVDLLFSFWRCWTFVYMLCRCLPLVHFVQVLTLYPYCLEVLTSWLLSLCADVDHMFKLFWSVNLLFSFCSCWTFVYMLCRCLFSHCAGVDPLSILSGSVDLMTFVTLCRCWPFIHIVWKWWPLDSCHFVQMSTPFYIVVNCWPHVCLCKYFPLLILLINFYPLFICV